MNIVRNHINEISKSGPAGKTIGVGIEHLIRSWLDDMKVTDYRIEQRGKKHVINVSDTVIITNKDIEEFPEYIQFGEVVGDFEIVGCGLKTMRGFPESVVGTLSVNYNRLVNLRYITQDIGGAFYCSNNLIKDISGFPSVGRTILLETNMISDISPLPDTVQGSLILSNNMISSLHGGPKHVIGSLYLSNNLLKDLSGAPIEVNGIIDLRGNDLKNIDDMPYNMGNEIKIDKVPKGVRLNRIRKMSMDRFNKANFYYDDI